MGELFNKGLDKSEKQEGLLKRLKNIEDKADNQLDLVRDRGDNQLDLIDENAGRTKSIGFKNRKLAELEKEIKDKEKEIRKNRRSKKKKIRVRPFLIAEQQMTHLFILAVIHT